MSDFSQEDRDLLAAEFENFGNSKLFQMYAQQVRSGRSDLTDCALRAMAKAREQERRALDAPQDGKVSD